MQLRAAILRPGAIEPLVFEQDADPRAIHLAAYRATQLAGCASAYPSTAQPWWPGHRPEHPWQMRGVATWPWARGAGCGRALVSAIEAEASAAGADALWCNARTGVLGFYAALGYCEVGERFCITGAGPHKRMIKLLGCGARPAP